MNDQLETYREIGKKIEEYLRPATFPLAIKLVREEAEMPLKSKRPDADLGLQNFICQNFRMARTYGWTIAVTEKDCSCRLARAVYGWDTEEESARWSHEFSVGLYAKDLKTSKKLDEHLYRFDGEYAGLVISPLTRTRVVPDVVQIYGFPAQAMRLIQSYLYQEGGVLEFTSAGKIGSCHEGVIKTFQTDLPQFVVLGNGDRVWGGAEDHEVMVSIPRGKLETTLRGLEATHRAGLRYPIPKYMNFNPGFQKAFELLARRRAGGTLVKE